MTKTLLLNPKKEENKFLKNTTDLRLIQKILLKY